MNRAGSAGPTGRTIIAAAAAVALAAAAVAASGDHWAAEWQIQPQERGAGAAAPAPAALPHLLPEAEAHPNHPSTKRLRSVTGSITEPHVVTIWTSVPMPGMRNLLNNPNFPWDGGDRPITSYDHTNHGSLPSNLHGVGLGGNPVGPAATGSMVINSGYVRECAPNHHCWNVHVPSRKYFSLYDKQRPHLDTSPGNAPVLDLSRGTLHFKTNENMHQLSRERPDAGKIALLQGVGYLSSQSAVAISGRDVTITLTPADHERMDVRLADRTSTAMKAYDGNRIRDTHNNELTTGRWWQGVSVIRDTAPPVLVRNPQLDFNTGVLTITFNEPVTWLYTPYLYLEDRNGGSHQHLSGASYPSPLDHAAVPITLSAAQLSRLDGMYLSTGGLRLDMLAGITADVAGNRFVAVHNRAIDVTRDSIKPTLASGSAPVVDMSRHTVSLSFSEKMDASETSPASVRLVNSSGGSVSLSGETVRSGDGSTVTLSLSALNKARAADLGTPLRVAFDANAFKDMWGNGIAASSGVAASVRADTNRPGAWGQSSLDMNDGVLTVGYTDAVWTDRVYTRGYALHVTDPSVPGRSTTVPMAGAAVITEDKFATRVAMEMTAAQKAAVTSAGGATPGVRMTIGGWAFQDYPAGNRGWYVSGAGFNVPVTADTTGPLNASAPALDLDAGTITIEFDEYIDASAYSPRGLELVMGNGTKIPIGGAALSPASDGDLVTLNLTDADWERAEDADDDGQLLSLTVPATAFYDMSGNAFAGLTASYLDEEGGDGAPVLDGNQILDLGEGVLDLAFSRNVTIPADLSGITVASLDGEVEVGLGGASVDEDSPADGLHIELTLDQWAELALEHEDGINDLALYIERGAIEAEGGRIFEGVSNLTLAVDDDDVAPGLADDGEPVADLRARTISMTFDEYIDLDEVDTAGMLVHDGRHPITGLGGASVSSPDGDDYGAELVIALTLAQVLEMISAAPLVGTNMYVNVSGSAVYDLSGNAFAGTDTSEDGGQDDSNGAQSRAANPGSSAPPLPTTKGLPMGLPPGAPGAEERAQPLGVNFLPLAPPALAGVTSPVKLDLNTGVLEVQFDTDVIPSRTNLTGATISGADVTVELKGAKVLVPSVDLNATVFVQLTANQKAGAVAAGPSAHLYLPAGFAWFFVDSDVVNEARIDIAADTTAPSLNATGTVLDLGTGTLGVVYDEYIAAPPGGLDAGAFAVVPAMGGERIPLDGALSIAAVNDTVAVLLAPEQKARLVQAVAAAPGGADSVRLDAAPGAALDVSRNPTARLAGANLSVVPDGASPVLDADPVLNLGTGTVTLTFDEFVNASGLAPQAVTVSDRDGNAAQSPSGAAAADPAAEEDGARLALEFSDGQIAALRAANASAGPLRIAIASSNGIADLSGNSFAALAAGAANLTVVDDAVPPALAAGRAAQPSLDLGSGILSMMFTEYVPAEGIDLSGAAIEDANGANRVPLSGARVVAPSGPEIEFRTIEDDTLRIFLTAEQKGAVARAHIEAGPVRLDLPSRSISDVAGLRFAGLSNAPLQIAADLTAPKIPFQSFPSLDVAHGLLTVPFDEHIDAEGADLAGIVLAGGPHGSAHASFSLAGAEIAPGLDSSELRVQVSPGRLAALVGGGLTGIPPSVNLTVVDGAVRDVSGNAFAGLDAEPIGAMPDETAPVLPSPPVVDLDDGAVVITFDEYVVASALNASGVSLVGVGSAALEQGGRLEPSMTNLAGANVSAYGPSIPVAGGGSASQSVLIAMTAEQKAGAVLSTASEIDIDGHIANLTDLSGNAYAGIDRGLASVVPDETGPDAAAPGAPSMPSLDMGAGVLTIPFDEHVDPASVDASRITVVVSAPPAPDQPPQSTIRVGLAGASSSDSLPGPSAHLALTGAQRAALQEALNASGGAMAASVAVDAARGAVSDLSGNRMPAERALNASVDPDRSGPGLAPSSTAVLDLDAGTVSLAFDEYVQPQGARAGLLSVTGPLEPYTVSLAGASFSSIDASSVLVMRLSPAEAEQVRGMRNDSASPMRISQSAPGAFYDLAGNPSGSGLLRPAGLAVDIVPAGDGGAPELDAASLDLASGTVSLTFNGAVDVGAIDLSGIAVMGRDRAGGSTPLVGASLQSSDGRATEVLIALTAGQKASIARSYEATGGSGSATIDISPSSVRDGYLRMSEGRAAAPMATAIDARSPVLAGAAVDLGAGTVLLEFDEYVDPAGVDAQRVSVLSAVPAPNATGDPVALDDSRILTLGHSQTVLLAVTQAEKAAIAGLLGASGTSPLNVSAAAGAAYDVSGNGLGAASTVSARVVPDASPPSLDMLHSPPSLDLGSGVLTMTFDEHVSSSPSPSLPTVSLSAAYPGAHQVRLSGGQQAPQQQAGAGDPSTVRLILTPAQKGALLSGGADAASAARLFLDAGAFADPSGNPSAPARVPRIAAVADAAPPALDAAHPPTLDMGSGALHIVFDEYIDPAAANLSGLSVSAASSGGGAAAARVDLTDAHVEPPRGGTDSVTLLLTRAERGMLAAALGGSPEEGAVLHLAAGAFADLSGNAIEAGSFAVPAVAPDELPPHMEGSAVPVLNLGTSPPSLVIDFDEAMDASAANLSLATLRVAAVAAGLGGGLAAAPVEIELAGAEVRGDGGDGHIVRISLSSAQAAGIEAAAPGGSDTAALPRAFLDADAGAFSDLAGNGLGALGNLTVAATRDAAAPALAASPRLALDGRSLSVSFTEPVRLSLPGDASELEISGAGGSHKFSLDGADVASPQGSSYSYLLDVRLTAVQAENAKLALLADGDLELTAPAGAVHDMAYNNFSGLDGTHMFVEPDAAGPRIAGQGGEEDAGGAGAGGPPAVLDLAHGLLTIRLNEHADSARADLSGAAVLRGSSSVSLAGAAVSGGALAASPEDALSSPSTTVRVLLTHGQAAGLATGAEATTSTAQPAYLSLPAGAFYDLAGNPSPADLNVTLAVVQDTSQPSVDAPSILPVLDLESGTIEVHFDEAVVPAASWPRDGRQAAASAADLGAPHMDIAVFDGSAGGDGRHRIPLTGHSVLTNGTDGDTITARIAADQRAALIEAVEASALLGFGAPAVLLLEDGFAADLAGNRLAGYGAAAGRAGGVAVAVVPDRTAPTLDASRQPVLDMGSGVLTVWFSEYVGADGHTPALLSLAVAGQGSDPARLPLAGASLASPPDWAGSAEVAVALTHDQKAWVAANSSRLQVHSASDALPVSLVVSAGAVSDLWGNANEAPASTAAVRVRGDNSPPELERPPVLNTAAGTVMIDLDEFADARAASAAGLTFANASGVEYTQLNASAASVVAVPAGAGLPDDYSDRIVITPGADDIAAMRLYAMYSDYATVNVSAGAVSDLAGNSLAAQLARAPIEATNDTGRPSLVNATVNLADGDVSLLFNEPVDAAGAALSQMRLVDPSGASGPVPLAGADLLLPNGGQPDDHVEMRLSGSQKAAAAAAAAGSAAPALRLEAPAGAVDDPYGNHAREIAADAAVVPDRKMPRVLGGPSSPVLDMGAGTLTVRFDEHISVSAVDASGVSVRGAAANGAAVQLAGAEVAAADRPAASGYSDAIVLDMPAAARAAAVQAVGARTLAGLLDIAANASVADASSNLLGSAEGIHMLVVPDRTPPHIDAPATIVDLRAGVLTIAVDEHVRLSSVDASRIAVGPPAAPTAGAAAPVGLGPSPASPAGASVAAASAASSDRIVIRMTLAQTSAVAAALAASPAAGATGSAALYVEPGAFADLSGNAHAGVRGLAAGATPPPVSADSAAITAPGVISVTYSYDSVEANSSHYTVTVAGTPRTITAVAGSGASAVHAVSFEPADAGPDATGTVSIAPLSGDGYLFGGVPASDPLAASDGQAPSAVRAAALGATSFSIAFDEAVAGVDAADLSVAAANGSAVAIESVSGSGPSRVVALSAPALDEGASGTVTVAGASFEDLAGNPAAAAPAVLRIAPATASVSANGTAPVHITGDSLARNITGASPSIDLSAVNGTFPDGGGDFVVTVLEAPAPAAPANGSGAAPAPAVVASVTFAANTTATVRDAADGAAAAPLVILLSAANMSALQDRSAVGAGEIGPMVEIFAASAPNATIDLSMPARILLPGAAGWDAFWIAPGTGASSLITTVCDPPADAASVAAQLGGMGECYADDGADLVIYTYHLTVFGAVSPQAAPRAALPALPGQAAGAEPAGSCSGGGPACSFSAADIRLNATRLAGPSAVVAGPSGPALLYAAGPAAGPVLGDSIYAVDPLDGASHEIRLDRAADAADGAFVAAGLPPLPANETRSVVRVLEMLPGGANPAADSPAGSPPYLLAAATLSIQPGTVGPPTPPTPVVLAIDTSSRSVAGLAYLSYTDRTGAYEDGASPALLGAYSAGGAAYAGMQVPAPGGRTLAGGPIVLVDTSDAPNMRAVPIYEAIAGADPNATLPSPESGYYYPREGWQPTAMAARGTTVYMVGAVWQQGAGAAGQGALPNSYGLHTVSFAEAEGGPSDGIAAQPRYTLASSIEAARLPDRDADNSSYTAAGMAIDHVRSKLYVLYSNGTLSAYGLDAPPTGGSLAPAVPSFMYHVDTAVLDPRDLALDAGTGILYAASGGSVRVYNASIDRLVTSVPAAAGDSGGIASLALSPPAAGEAGPTVYAVPSSPGGQLRAVQASSGTAPNVTSVSAPAGTYAAGDSVEIKVMFSRPVAVAGTPEIELDVGSPKARAAYASGSGTPSLSFMYEVRAGDKSDDLMYTGTGALALPAGASITGAADGITASRALPPPGPLGAGAGAVRIGAPEPAGMAPAPLPPVAVPFLPSGGGGGGGGGGGSGRTGVAPAADSVLVRSVSWDCDAGTMSIAAAVDSIPSPAPEVAVLSSAGSAAAELVGSGGSLAPGVFNYEAPLPDDTVVSIRAVLVDGRTAASDSKTVRIDGRCAGEIAFDAGRGAPEAPAAAAADSPAADGAPPPPESPAEPEPRDAPAAPEPEAEPRDAPEPAPRDADDSAEPEPAPRDADDSAEPEPTRQEPGEQPAQQQPQQQQPVAEPDSGGCLIATAAHGTELAPQVQALREVRDRTLLSTDAGAAFMAAFSPAYYAVSPHVADLERAHPAFRDAAALALAPLLYALQVVDLAEPGSEHEVAAYGALAIALVAGMYVAAPAAGALFLARRLS